MATVAGGGDDARLKTFLEQLVEIISVFQTAIAKQKNSKDAKIIGEKKKIQESFDQDFDRTLDDAIQNLSEPYKNCLLKLQNDLQLDEKRKKNTPSFPLEMIKGIGEKVAELLSVLEAFQAAWTGDFEIVKNFLKRYPQWTDQPGIHGTTLLYCAARNNHLPIVKYLIEEAKGNVNVVNREYYPIGSKSRSPAHGSTALHVACYHGHLNIVQYLTCHGADYFLLNAMGESPLFNGKRQPAIEEFFEAFLLLSYTKSDERLCTRSAIDEVRKVEFVDDAIWEYQSPNDGQWLSFAIDESKELQTLFREQVKPDQPFQSVPQLTTAKNLYSISFQQFTRLGKNRFGQGKKCWVRCRASPIKNFGLFTSWQMMFTRYPQAIDDLQHYEEINPWPKKKSSIKLHSWYHLEPELNLCFGTAMNYRRKYFSLHLPVLCKEKIFFDYEKFIFFTEDHAIEGFLRWLPKLISDDLRKFQVIDNFQFDEQNPQKLALTLSLLDQLKQNHVLTDAEIHHYDLRNSSFGDRTEPSDLALFQTVGEKAKASIMALVSILPKKIFDIKSSALFIPYSLKELVTTATRIGQSGVSSTEAKLKRGEINDYLVPLPIPPGTKSEQWYFVQWNGDNNPDRLRQSLEKFVSLTIKEARKENYQSILYPAIDCSKFKCSTKDGAFIILKQLERELSEGPMHVIFSADPDQMNLYRDYQEALQKVKNEKEEEQNQPISIQFGNNSTMVVMKGDLTKEKTDVIAASSSSENLAQILLNAAGEETSKHFYEQLVSNPNALVIVLPPGELQCKNIFFLKWEPNKDEEVLKQSIEDLIHNLVQNLIQHKFTSLAFPAIGCGEYGFNINILVKTMVRCFRTELMKRKLPWRIHFVIQPHQQQIFDEFSRQLIACNQSDGGPMDYKVPSTWTGTAPGEKRVSVDLKSPECQPIFKQFDETMKGKYSRIVRIERIQNERWYMQYLAHKRDFYQRLNKDTEKRLFHGCPEDAAKLIINDCFNRSFAGKNGTSYGVGVYFSSLAVYSNGYAKPNMKGERCMFLCQVLVGKTTVGNSSMKVRPVGFDSTTDGNHIIVTYHDAQAYAEYLIYYQ